MTIDWGLIDTALLGAYLSTGQGLDKDDREYLRDNYSEDQE